MKMFCAHLADYLDGNLSERQRVAMADHVADCDACATEVDQWHGIAAAIRDAQPVAEAPSPAQVTRLEALGRERLRRSRPIRWRWAASALTAGVALSVLIWPSREQPTVEGPKGVAVAQVVEEIVAPRHTARQQSLGPHQLGLEAGARAQVLESKPHETRVRLTVGTVVFAVAPRRAGERFIVEAGDHRIEVIGTRFYVTLSENADVEVGVSKGTVDVRDANLKWHRLEAGDKLRSFDEEPISLGSAKRQKIDHLLGLARAEPTRAEPPPKSRRDLEQWRAWLEAGSHEVVEISVREHLRITPRDAEAWVVLAEARTAAARWQPAVEAYRQVIAMQWSHHANPARYEAALLLLDRLAEPGEAAELLEAYLTHKPRPFVADASVALARAQKGLGRGDVGSEILRRVMMDHRGTPAAIRARHLLQSWDR